MTRAVYRLSHPIYQTRQRAPKWSGSIGPLGPGHGTAHAGRMVRDRYAIAWGAAPWAEARGPRVPHADIAAVWTARGARADETWQRLVTSSVMRYGEHGPLISGVYRAHFPARIKARLRALCAYQNAARDAAEAHAWAAKYPGWTRAYPGETMACRMQDQTV